MDRKLYMIDMDVRRTGRAMSYGVDQILNTVRQYKRCSPNQALLILRCCGSVLVDLSSSQRTALMTETLDILSAVPELKFDVSHYNAMMKAHIENENYSIASDFLSEMENANVAPNRVTFQHLVGMYCHDGNIGGATTVLEHMKSEEMAINETVFLSLLKCHCLNLDHGNVNSTLEVMAKSGLHIGAETFSLIASSYGQVGAWDKVQEILAKAKEDDVKLDDADIFSVILGCVKGGLHKEAASELVPLTPKKAGYFQAMRNAVPQLIHAGAVDIAVDIFLEFPLKQESERNDKGKFIFQAMSRAGVDPAKAIDVMTQLQKAGYNYAMEHLLEAAIEMGTTDFCVHLKEEFEKAEIDIKTTLTDSEHLMMCRRTLNPRIQNSNQVMQKLRNFHSMDLTVPFSILSRDVLGNMVDLDKELPIDTVKRLRNECTYLNNVSNVMVQCLLNKEDERHMQAATNFMLNTMSKTNVNPSSWSQSLVRSYLPTGLIDDLVTCLWYGSRSSNITTRNTVEDVFRGLTCLPTVLHRYDVELDVATHLRKILTALVEHKVGLPKEIGDQLLPQEPTLKSLVEEAVGVWEAGAEYWTPEREDEFFNKRKKLHLGNTPRPAGTYIGEYTQVEGSLQDMEAAQQRLESYGKVNYNLINNLINAYSENNQTEKALKVLEYAQSKGDYKCSPISWDKLINTLIRNEMREKALAVMENAFESGETTIFASTYFDLLFSMVKAGEHEKVLDLLGDQKMRDRLINFRGDLPLPLCSVYRKAGEVDKLEALQKTLLINNWANNNDNRFLGQYVMMHIDNGNLAEALEEMEKVVKEHNKMPHKNELTHRIIEKEDLDLLQKILDLSIENIGEEQSLYDLSYCFLDMGRSAQAKKLLETPGIRYRHNRMVYMIEQFRKNGKPEAVESLVNVSKGIFECDRDFLFHELVKTFEKDPERIQEVWVQIQEEGHAPSDSLKIAIAKALKGRNVPFEIPEEQSKEIPKTESKPKPKEEKKGPSNTPKAAGPDDDIIAAFNAKNFTSAQNLLKDALENETLKGFRIVKMLKECVDKNFAEGVILTTIVNNSSIKKIPEQQLRLHNAFIMQLFCNNNDLKGCQDFFDSINDDRKKYLSDKLENVKLNLIMMNDEPAYLDLVKKDPIEKNYGVWTLPAYLAVKATPEFITELQNIAKGNNLTAQFVLMRIGIGKNDNELLKETWNLVQNKAEHVANFIPIPNEENLKLICETLKGEELAETMKSILKNSNKCKLGVVLEMTKIFTNNSGNLSDLENATLRSLLKSKDFEVKARKILTSREEAAEESTSSTAESTSS